jgi:hypothetical protein
LVIVFGRRMFLKGLFVSNGGLWVFRLQAIHFFGTSALLNIAYSPSTGGEGLSHVGPRNGRNGTDAGPHSPKIAQIKGTP